MLPAELFDDPYVARELPGDALKLMAYLQYLHRSPGLPEEPCDRKQAAERLGMTPARFDKSADALIAMGFAFRLRFHACGHIFREDVPGRCPSCGKPTRLSTRTEIRLGYADGAPPVPPSALEKPAPDPEPAVREPVRKPDPEPAPVPDAPNEPERKPAAKKAPAKKAETTLFKDEQEQRRVTDLIQNLAEMTGIPKAAQDDRFWAKWMKAVKSMRDQIAPMGKGIHEVCRAIEMFYTLNYPFNQPHQLAADVVPCLSGVLKPRFSRDNRKPIWVTSDEYDPNPPPVEHTLTVENRYWDPE